MSGGKTVRRLSIGFAIIALVVGGVMTLFAVGDPPDGDYGDLALPGSTVLHLPAEQVELNFTEDTDNQTIDVPVRLTIDVTPVAGGPELPVTVVDGSSVGINGVSHVYWGYVVVPREGDYRVNIPDSITPSIPNPHMLFGPDTAPLKPLLIGGGIAVVLLIVAMVARGVVRRSRAVAAD
jgi:hypothetical protein